MILPQIGQTVNTDYGLRLCNHFNLDYLSQRIMHNPQQYTPWIFDGVSGISDTLLNFLLLRKDNALTFQCALPHDLGYAYGALGNSDERKEVDKRFYKALRTADVSRPIALGMYYCVRVFGTEKFNFSCSWGYANRDRTVLPLLIVA